MSHVKSNFSINLPRNSKLKVPVTREEFMELSYSERVQLQAEHPAIYRRFTDQRKPWEV